VDELGPGEWRPLRAAVPVGTPAQTTRSLQRLASLPADSSRCDGFWEEPFAKRFLDDPKPPEWSHQYLEDYTTQGSTLLHEFVHIVSPLNLDIPFVLLEADPVEGSDTASDVPAAGDPPACSPTRFRPIGSSVIAMMSHWKKRIVAAATRKPIKMTTIPDAYAFFALACKASPLIYPSTARTC